MSSAPPGFAAYAVRNRIEPQIYGDGLKVDRVLDAGGDLRRTPPFHAGLLARHFAFFPHSAPSWTRPDIKAEPLSILTAERAAVAGLDAAVLVEDGWVDRIQLYFVNYGREGCHFKRPEPQAADILARTPGRHLAGDYFLGFNAAYSNYAHWTSDHLPALIAFRDHYMAGGCKLLLPPLPAAHFATRTVELLGIPQEAIVFLKDEVVSVDRLFFLSYFNFSAISDFALAAQETLKASVPDLPAPRTRRIFVSRPDSLARRLLNEAEVVAALAPYGIEVVAPGLLSLEEQVRTFHAADLVVGPHGAGVVNCGFCTPGATLLELFSEYTVQSQFWLVASFAGMRYGFQAGTSFDQDWALWSESDNWDAPYVLDTDAVVMAVQKAITASASKAAF